MNVKFFSKKDTLSLLEECHKHSSKGKLKNRTPKMIIV
jgi:hypothetical protein